MGKKYNTKSKLYNKQTLNKLIKYINTTKRQINH